MHAVGGHTWWRQVNDSRLQTYFEDTRFSPKVKSFQTWVRISVIMGTLFPTQIPTCLLPAGTGVPIYCIEHLPSFKIIGQNVSGGSQSHFQLITSKYPYVFNSLNNSNPFLEAVVDGFPWWAGNHIDSCGSVSIEKSWLLLLMVNEHNMTFISKPSPGLGTVIKNGRLIIWTFELSEDCQGYQDTGNHIQTS